VANSRIGALIGAGLVVFGSALPVLQAPVYGSITLLETNVGGVTVIAAVAGAVLGLLGLWPLLRIAAIVCFGAVGFFLLNYFSTLTGNRGQMRALEDGLGGSFSLQIGLLVVGLGIILMLNNSKSAPLIAPKQAK
jgi:hypothetical protein